MPRKPYQSPRDWLHENDRRMFGNSGTADLSWRQAQTPLDAALLAAAKKQCSIAFLIRISGGARMPPPALAAAIDLHPDTVRDILNGSKHATIAVLYAMTTALGLDLTLTAKKPRSASPVGDEALAPGEEARNRAAGS